MKLTLSWLKTYLDTDYSVDQIADTLTALGLEIDDVINYQEKYQDFYVVEVLERKDHPNSDKLAICKIETKDGPIEIVTNSDKFVPGVKAAFAPNGTFVPGLNMKLAKVNIRGVESSGMFCGKEELGITFDLDFDGIITDANAKVGDPIAAYLGLDDVVFDIDLTPNRADCLGVYPIAYDLAAAGAGTLKEFKMNEVKPTIENTVQVEIADEAKEACIAFGYCLIKNVKNGQSSDWVQKQLTLLGQRPISALVDVTNYVMFEAARPMHVYDADKVKGLLKVHLSKKGDTFLGLDEKEHSLEDGMLVISDDNGIHDLAGIMGGEATAVDENTTNVIVECAAFDSSSIARTGRKLGIITEARHRFERYVAPQSIQPCMEFAIDLITQFCGGEVSDIKIAGEISEEKTEVRFRPKKLMQHCGIEISDEAIQKILTDLGFIIDGQADGAWLLRVPFWRSDITLEEDVFEEVIRIYGYDNIPAVSFTAEGFHPETIGWNAKQKRENLIRSQLASRGLLETVTWSFLSEENAKLFGEKVDLEQVTLMNAISQDLSIMRPSVIPNLIEAAVTNDNHGQQSAAFFEVGPVYQGLKIEDQIQLATGLRCHLKKQASWSENEEQVSLYDAKADAYAVLEVAGLNTDNLQLQAEGPTYYHPGRVATILLGKMVVGYFGELHPQLLKRKGYKGRMVAFEVNLDALPPAKDKRKNKAFISYNLQSVERDFAFLVDKSVKAGELMKLMRSAEKKFISDIHLFDVYEGDRLPEGKKSLALKVTLQPTDKTFTDEDLEEISQKIIQLVTDKTGAELRDH